MLKFRELCFQDGSSEECDILVVADGHRSRLRACLRPEETPSHPGIIMLMACPSSVGMLGCMRR